MFNANDNTPAISRTNKGNVTSKSAPACLPLQLCLLSSACAPLSDEKTNAMKDAEAMRFFMVRPLLLIVGSFGPACICAMAGFTHEFVHDQMRTHAGH